MAVNKDDFRREEWGDVDVDGSFAYKLYHHNIWLEDTTSDEAERFILRDGEILPKNLSGANLSKAILRETDLSEAILRGANLYRAELTGAVLRGAILRGAVMAGADLTGIDLSGAILREADLSGAILSVANLKNAKMSYISLEREIATLDYADLRGLEIFHKGKFFDKNLSREIAKDIVKERGFKDVKLGMSLYAKYAIATSFATAVIGGIATYVGPSNDFNTESPPSNDNHQKCTVTYEETGKTIKLPCNKLTIK